MPNIRTETWNGYEIRFVEKGGEWWAVAKDVAEALGYAHTPHMVRLLDPKDRGVHKVDTVYGLGTRVQEVTIISEIGIYDAIFNSQKPEAKEFKCWVFDMIKTLRQASGLEGFQVFRMLDKAHQVEHMYKLSHALENPVQVDFIKANTITNKAVSNMYGHKKMVKKANMTPEMLVARQPILEDTVDLMSVNKRFNLGISVSQAVYGKYQV
jgi:prophage antirepressor-like protein